MGETELVALRAGVSSVTLPDGSTRLFAWPHAQSFGRLTDTDKELLRALAGTPRSVASEGLVEELRDGGWLCITALDDHARPTHTLMPRRPPPTPPPATTGAELELSRFAVLRRDSTGMLAESPLAWCDLRVQAPELLSFVADLDTAPARLRRDLLWAGLAVPTGGESEFCYAQWSQHELRFHERSRIGYRNGALGGIGRTGWARGRFEPLPARPPHRDGRVVELAVPDMSRVCDPTLSQVLDRRRSIRVHNADRPITHAQLSEFLYRGAYTRVTAEEHRRPYPSGGGTCELELYPIVHHADGIPAAMYHYDSYGHRLRQVAPATAPPVRRLLRVAKDAAAAPETPQILIVISARVGRVMWRYESMAYALILKHVGVLMQTLYCVATAMGLAPCALGCGDDPAFAEATGLAALEEPSVGEFLIGAP